MTQYPGSNFTIISDKIKSFVSGPDTETLLIIGTSQDGPLNVPISITSIQEAESYFGPATYSAGFSNPKTNSEDSADAHSSLVKAVAQAIGAGTTSILAVRATGTYAVAPSAFSSKLSLTSVNPGRIYNSVSVSMVTSGGALNVQLTQPTAKGNTFVTSYASSLSVGQFIDQFNGNKNNRTVEILKDAYPSILSNACTTLGTSALVTVTLAGGTNGTSAPSEDYETSLDGYATKLTTTNTGTFDMLKNNKWKFNVAVLTGIHLDDQVVTSGQPKPSGTGNWSASDEVSISIAADFVNYIEAVSSEINPCHGVIGLRPPQYRSQERIITYLTDSLLTTTASAYRADLRWNRAGYFLFTGFKKQDTTGLVVDRGRYLSVCAGPEVVFSHPGLGNYTDNFHVAYASMLTTVPPERAPIMKPIQGIQAYGTAFPENFCKRLLDGLGYDAQSRDLNGKGAYVCLTKNPRDPSGPLVIYDDVTAADRDDYMRNYQIVHLCNSINSSLDNALAPYLGKPMDDASIGAMESAIINILDGYAQSNALKGKRGQGYDYRVQSSPVDSILGVLRVQVEIVPSSVLRKIYFTVNVRQPA